MGARRRHSAIHSALDAHQRTWTGDADVSAEAASPQDKAFPSVVYMVPECGTGAGCFSGGWCPSTDRLGCTNDLHASFESIESSTPKMSLDSLNDSVCTFASMHSASVWKLVDSFNALMACAADAPERIGDVCGGMCGRGPVDPPGAGGRFDEDTCSMRSWWSNPCADP